MRTTAFFLLAGFAATASLGQMAGHMAMLKGVGGKDAGMVTLTDSARGTVLKVQAKGLTPGWHAIHFHEKGDCSDAAFKAAGGHVHSAMPAVHGLLNDAGNDQGDLPNIWVGADGTANAELFSPFVSTMGGAGKASLLDADGSAIVIHANADDYKTQPIGGAGDRVVCGVIK